MMETGEGIDSSGVFIRIGERGPEWIIHAANFRNKAMSDIEATTELAAAIRKEIEKARGRSRTLVLNQAIAMAAPRPGQCVSLEELEQPKELDDG